MTTARGIQPKEWMVKAGAMGFIKSARMDGITKYTFKKRFKRISNIFDLNKKFMTPSKVFG